jgi:calcineurin-like phosphoesterase family protein
MDTYFISDTHFGHTNIIKYYAMRVGDRSHHGAGHLYGHSYGRLPDDPASLSFDVGVDAHEFRPWSFEEVCERMARKSPALATAGHSSS